MPYKTIEEQHTYNKIYYADLKNTNPELYNKRLVKARENYLKNREKILQSRMDNYNNKISLDKPKRVYKKREIKNQINYKLIDSSELSNEQIGQ